MSELELQGNKMLEKANIQYQPGVTNPAVFKANLADYLYQKSLISWTEDINRDNARQGNGKNKLRTYKLFKSGYITKSIETVLFLVIIEVLMPNVAAVSRQYD